MKHWSARQALALFLAVFVTVGIGVSTSQASDMAAKMTMAVDMGASGDQGCPACPGGDDGDKAMPCSVACVAPVLAVLPQATAIILAQRARPVRALYLLLRGRAPPPDPYPPRSTDIV